LANTVGTKIEADTGIFVMNCSQRFAFVIDTNKGDHELIGDVLVVRIFHALDWVDVFAAFSFAGNHGIESLGHAFPSAIAVHGVVASADGSDLAGVVLADFLLQLFQISGAVGWQSVSAIHKGVHEDAVNAILLGHL